MTASNVFTQDMIQQSMSKLSLSAGEEHSSKTIYEKVKFIYSRDEKYNLLNSAVYRGELSEGFMNSLKEAEKTFLNNGFTKMVINEPQALGEALIAWEFERDSHNVAGVVTENFEPTDFDKWFLYLLVSTSRIDFLRDTNKDYETHTRLITEEFAKTIKNTTASDKWDVGGRAFFTKKVDFFTSRGLTIEAVLPAFPCKSSNFNKVATWKPDKGEELALKTLITFARNVKRIYPPGIIVWIVSDGHVFSDCIGVNDVVVDEYSSALQTLYKSINTSNDVYIKFCSLKDIFSLEQSPISPHLVANVELEHYLETKIDDFSELCRKILVYSCDTDAGELKRDINTPCHPRLYLYRGFAKFMEEDLVGHPVTEGFSKKKYKKTVSKIAFEMIKRNDAYSNLVELMFPCHLRFSIHAHNNSGPKFGIKLLASETCKVIKSLEESNLPDFNDLLHIPTPWHNSILKVDGMKHYFVTRSDVIKEAIVSGTHIGEWDKKEGYFLLSAKKT